MSAARLLRCTAATLLSAASASADVWSVNVGGTGDFVDLQAAVDHALPGDVILLWGPANGRLVLRPVTITKGLTVIGLAPERVRLDDLTVRDLPAGQPVGSDATQSLKLRLSLAPDGSRHVETGGRMRVISVEVQSLRAKPEPARRRTSERAGAAATVAHQ